jgi:methylated-DNA-[protein]-cysteine S-methyltransferase
MAHAARLSDEVRAIERIVAGAFRGLTSREGEAIRYAMMDDTPVGLIGLAAGRAGLVRLDYVDGEDQFVERLLGLFGEAPVVRSPALDQARRELDQYFAGRRRAFDLDVDLSRVSEFDRRVLRVTARVPRGRVATYQEVARRAGNPRASRAAGNALHKNPVAIIIPCHRVVRSDGSLGGYGGGVPVKEYLLRLEGALPEEPRE